MKQAYIFVEGEPDVAILKKLLPANLRKGVEILAGGGVDGATTLAASYLAKRRRPVALVLDADTNDKELIYERYDVARWSLDQVSGSTAFEVLIAKPSIEAVFFQDQALLEAATQHKFTELEWRLAKLQPQEILAKEPNGKLPTVQKLLDSLNKESIEKLRQHPLIQSLINFLSSVASNGKVQNGRSNNS
jgi:hypothetical protein